MEALVHYIGCDVIMHCYRSVSLVGEKERKMLKDIVKKATNPVKSRIIPHG